MAGDGSPTRPADERRRVAAMLVGRQLGAYRIEQAIGAGGMGDVYRALDTRLGRAVALKVLPAVWSEDPERRSRFEREARVVASLNHPNICTIHDVGRDQGIDYLVMELIEGESLAVCLARGPLPPAQALARAIEIADALDKAHRQGIVHRDLKPGNVMLTRTGSVRSGVAQAKLLDFGLARIVTTAADDTQTGTQAGAVVGTLQYMAPEQLEGRPADARTDIFAFGALLYEMLTGRRAFDTILGGGTPSSGSVQLSRSSALDQLVRTCMARDPDDRYSTMHDVLLQLRWIADTDVADAALAATGPHTTRLPLRTLAFGAVGLAVAVAAGVGWGVWLRDSDSPSVGRAIVTLLPVAGDASWIGNFSVSPDGKALAVVSAPSATQPQSLWLRRLDSPDATLLPGTDGAEYPFWSPDGRSLAFFAGGKLKRLDIDAGAAFPLCDVDQGRGGSWHADGTIVFAALRSGGLKRVSSSGGEPAMLVPFDKEKNMGLSYYTFPIAIGARQLMYLARADDDSRSELRLTSLDAPGQWLSVVASPERASYINGVLFYARQGDTVAQRFDERTGKLMGNPVVLTGDQEHDGHLGYSRFSAGGTTLAWWTQQSDLSELRWLDRSGTSSGLLGAADAYETTHFSLSPDDRYVAAAIAGDIWLVDAAAGGKQRLTSHPAEDYSPRWSPNATQVAFTSSRGVGGNQNIYAVSISRPDDIAPLVEVPLAVGSIGWTPSGQFVWLQSVNTTQKANLSGPDWWNMRGLMMDAPGGAGRSLVNADVIYTPALSPDGTTIAYPTTLAGRWEILVDSLLSPGSPQRLQWSSATQPRRLQWRADGRELIFKAGDDVYGAPVQSGATITLGVPGKLFETRGTDGLAVTRDGQRFLVRVPLTTRPAHMTVVLNWSLDDVR